MRIAERFGVLGALVACCAAALTTGCTGDDSSSPSGGGDNVAVDVPPTMQPDQNKYDGGGDSPFAPVDGGLYSKPDGYDPYGVCKACGCPATDYCFGGGTGYTTFTTCTPTTFGVGCQPIPAACAADASCDCLIQATAGMVPCYPECVDTTHILYCPNP